MEIEQKTLLLNFVENLDLEEIVIVFFDMTKRPFKSRDDNIIVISYLHFSQKVPKQRFAILHVTVA